MEFKNYLGQPINVRGHHPLPEATSNDGDKVVPLWRSIPGRSGDYVGDEAIPEVLNINFDSFDTGTFEFDLNGYVGSAGFVVLQGPRIAVVDIEVCDSEYRDLNRSSLTRQLESEMNSLDILQQLIPLERGLSLERNSVTPSDAADDDDDVPF